MQLPATHAQLVAARDALVRRSRARNATFRLMSASLTTFRGLPAVDLRGTQRIFGRTIETRSLHVFRAGEYVFEALAPPSDFVIVNQRVLEPLLRTLRFAPLCPSCPK